MQVTPTVQNEDTCQSRNEGNDQPNEAHLQEGSTNSDAQNEVTNLYSGESFSVSTEEEMLQTNNAEQSSENLFADQVVVREDEEEHATNEGEEGSGIMSTPSVPHGQDNGVYLLVTNGHEFVQTSADQDPVMACQICDRAFYGNHILQVTLCHECNRFEDHGPYDAMDFFHD